jgi:PAS domain S-box-containing protein
MAQSRAGKKIPSSRNGAFKKPKKKPAGMVSGRKLSAAIPPLPLSAVASSRVGLWELNTVTGRVLWSTNCARVLGFPEIQLLPLDIEELMLRIHDHDREKFGQALKQVRKGIEFQIEVRVITHENSYRWIEFSAEIQPDLQPVLIQGVVLDVTIRKLTEFELYDWKTRNELVSESAGLLIYDYDISTGDIFWSGNMAQLVGYGSEEVGRIEQWESLIHPEDRHEASTLLEYSRETLKPYDVYYRFKRKNHGYCYMHDRGQFVADSTGRAVRMLGVMNDVSERIAADRTIKQSEKSYRELFDSVGEAIYIQSSDGTFLDVNKTACDIYGYSKEELLGKNPGFIAVPGKNDFDDLRRKMADALSGKIQSFLWRGRTKKAEHLIMEVRLTKGTYFGNECIIATSWDITDKIAAEMSLQESEKRFRRLVQDLHVGVLLLGANGDVQVVNTAASSLLGVPEKSLLNQPFPQEQWKFLTDEEQVMEIPALPWNRAALSGKAERGTVVGIQNGKSNIMWALVNAEPILLVDQKLLHVVITFTDITERKRVEEDLKESELRFRTLQEASFGGIGLHNKGVIIDCNQGLCEITGYGYDELIGSNGLNLIAPEYHELVYQKIINKEEQPYDVEGVRKNGSRYYLEIHGKNIPYQEGSIRVTEFRDITDRKAVESKMLEQNARLLSITEDLKIRNEQLQEFTQIVSHNLRSPVGNMLSLLNFIENSETESERAEYITLLREAGATTLTTLQELNEVLQINQNKNIEKQMLEFEHVFSHVRRMLVAKIVEVNAQITTDFADAPNIEYPNIYLESILLNLLSNALKYQHPGRAPVITVRTLKTNDGISLAVSDNGQGINMQRYGHQVFKLRKTFHKHPESRGIGLFMIKNQIDAMGGDISVSSIENEGTTFLVNFAGKITRG